MTSNTDFQDAIELIFTADSILVAFVAVVFFFLGNLVARHAKN